MPGHGIRIVRGREPILQMQQVLVELSARCGQIGAMDDLAYFLSKLGALKKIPYLILISRSSESSTKSAENLSTDGLVAALLLYEHKAAGYGIGIFATDDTTGRRTLVAPASLRSAVAMIASRKLLDLGARSVLISFRHDASTIDPSIASVLQSATSVSRWATREREIVGYLPLEGTFDATLAKMGQRTRNHLRYYRRRAEAQLGCSFFPVVEMGRTEFLALSRGCAYAVTDDVAGWRYDSLKDLETPLFMGIRDKDGRWLSLVAGRRHHARMEVHWQMNRSDLPEHSLSTVMRAYLIEHEILQGTTRLYFEGGTTHSMNHSFIPERSTDLIVMRRSPFAAVIPILAKCFLPPENMLLQVLSDENLQWHLQGKR
ncbi:MAG: hypothetical protein JWQ42_2892 [Edaphobacter sp.]|nr:hypothetical protein [Edaphobacter sp.]